MYSNFTGSKQKLGIPAVLIFPLQRWGKQKISTIRNKTLINTTFSSEVQTRIPELPFMLNQLTY